MADAMTDDSMTGSGPVAGRHQIDAAALAAWLQQEVPGFSGPLTIEQFKGGQSNPTYKLITPARSYVMRAKPGPAAKLLPSAHAIEREYRVLKALASSDVPVGEVICLCQDEAVIGRAFYIMAFVDGRVFWEQSLPGMEPSERGRIYDEMNRVISSLHKVDFQAIGLGDFGKPGNYFARQVGRWSKQYIASETELIPEMNRLIDWLPAHIPAGDETAIVHGDFRLDNMIFARNEPKVIAVLDWELSTLGHPLADFSYHCMGYHIPPDQFRGVAGLDLAALGIPSEQDYKALYCRRTGRAEIQNWDFYLAYNCFRLAAILQGIMKRVVDGTAASAEAAKAGSRARPLAQLAWGFAQRIGV